MNIENPSNTHKQFSDQSLGSVVLAESRFKSFSDKISLSGKLTINLIIFRFGENSKLHHVLGKFKPF